MFEVSDTAVDDPDSLTASFLTELKSIARTDPDKIPPVIATALTNNDPTAITLSQAATILAMNEDRLDSQAIEAELRDRILIGMSTAVLDVDRLASEMAIERSPKALQQGIEGRAPLTLREFAHIQSVIATRVQ